MIKNKIDYGAVATWEKLRGAYSSFMSSLPNPDDVLRKLGKSIDSYNELKYDSHVYSCMQSRKAGAMSLEWEINKGSESVYDVQFIEDFFKNEIDLNKLMSDILETPFFGYQVFEIIWRENKGRFIPASITAKPHSWFLFDAKNNLRFKELGNTQGILLSKDKFVLCQNNATYINPYGDAILSRCWWHVFFKKETVKFWSAYTEKYGVPMLHGTVPDGFEKETDALNSAMTDLIEYGIISTQENRKINMLNFGNSGNAELYKGLIDYSNSEISKAILSQTLTTENTGSTGSYAMSKTHGEVRREVVLMDKKLIETTINKIIKLIIDFNFYNVSYPKFLMFELEDVDRPLAEVVNILAGPAGFRPTKKFFMNRFGFNDDEFDIQIQMPASSPVSPAPVLNEVENLSYAGDVETTETKTTVQKLNEIALKDFGKATDDLISPVIDLIKKGDSYDDIQNQLFELFPNLDSSEIEEIIAKGILLSNYGGQSEPAD